VSACLCVRVCVSVRLGGVAVVAAAAWRSGRWLSRARAAPTPPPQKKSLLNHLCSPPLSCVCTHAPTPNATHHRLQALVEVGPHAPAGECGAKYIIRKDGRRVNLAFLRDGASRTLEVRARAVLLCRCAARCGGGGWNNSQPGQAWFGGAGGRGEGLGGACAGLHGLHRRASPG
jgi:hypothetical protein